MGNTELAEAFKLAKQYVGCGDNSCRFQKPKGMATNGGCRCSDRPFVMAALAKLYKTVERVLADGQD